MKKYKLTLIELLISMAIFTIMMSLLIKAFQLTTDLSSAQESKTKKIEQSQLALSLMANELKAALVREGTSWIRTGENTYEKVDKSMHFYINTVKGSEELRFYYPNTNFNDSDPKTYVNVIQYKVVNGNLQRFERANLVAYEDPGWANGTQGSLKLNAFTSDTNHVLYYAGLASNGQPKALPDPSVNNYGEILLKALDGAEGMSDFSLSYHLKTVKENNQLMLNPSIDSNGDWVSNSSSKAILKEGQKPDFITISFTLGIGDNAQKFSRMISLNGR